MMFPSENWRGAPKKWHVLLPRTPNPRHEYFRRILCNLFGTEIENGEMPNDIDWVGKVIQDICYRNARSYFNWQEAGEAVLQKVK